MRSKICIARTHHYHPSTPAEEHGQRTKIFISEEIRKPIYLLSICHLRHVVIYQSHIAEDWNAKTPEH
jgi:hypothetical protein